MLTLEENWEKTDLEFIAKKFEEIIRYCQSKGVEVVNSKGEDFIGETTLDYSGLYGKKKITIY